MRDEQATEKEIQDKGLNAPRLTPADIDAQIVSEYYVRASDAVGGNTAETPSIPVADSLKCLTICILVLKNGFTVTGESACASPENYDRDIGTKIARENARAKIWAFEGYLLKSILSGRVSKAAITLLAPFLFFSPAQAQQQPVSGGQTFSVSVTADELNTIGAALELMPYGKVAGLVDNLRQQARKQMQAMQAPKPPEAEK